MACDDSMLVPARQLSTEELKIATSILNALKAGTHILYNEENGYDFDFEGVNRCHHQTCCGYEILQEPQPSIEEEVLWFLERGYKLVEV